MIKSPHSRKPNVNRNKKVSTGMQNINEGIMSNVQGEAWFVKMSQGEFKI